MNILANHNEHSANTAERLESYRVRIAALEAELSQERSLSLRYRQQGVTLEAELATERARLDKLVEITHWTHEQMHKGPRAVLDDLILKGVKR